MSSTKTTAQSDVEQPATILHLISPLSHGKPLCGEESPDAAIGGYSEHLDGEEYVRQVFGSDGAAGKACEKCLSLYPSKLASSVDNRKLNRVIEFAIAIRVVFVPNTTLSGYDVTASGIGTIGDQSVTVCVIPLLAYTSARFLRSLQFKLFVDAPGLVPLVNTVNKDK